MKKKNTNKLFYLAILLLLLAVFAAAGARLGGYSVFAVSGSSMEPHYPPRSVVVVKKTDLSSLKIGDRIVFSSAALGGKNAFHRVVEIADDGVYTKGDNNAGGDNQLVTSARFVGKEAFKIMLFARLFAFFGNSPALLFMPLAALALAVAAAAIAFDKTKMLEKSIHEKNK